MFFHSCLPAIGCNLTRLDVGVWRNGRVVYDGLWLSTKELLNATTRGYGGFFQIVRSAWCATGAVSADVWECVCARVQFQRKASVRRHNHLYLCSHGPSRRPHLVCREYDVFFHHAFDFHCKQLLWKQLPHGFSMKHHFCAKHKSLLCLYFICALLRPMITRT
jgi:hypothetical protein